MKIEKILLDCYRELYANSEPKGNFDELLQNATLNEFGEKEIPYNDYFIDKETFFEIVDRYKKKIKQPCYKRSFSISILLGCSPMFKK